jgi:hypothetical protein
MEATFQSDLVRQHFVGAPGFEPGIHADYLIYSQAPNQFGMTPKNKNRLGFSIRGGSVRVLIFFPLVEPPIVEVGLVLQADRRNATLIILGERKAGRLPQGAGSRCGFPALGSGTLFAAQHEDVSTVEGDWKNVKQIRRPIL